MNISPVHKHPGRVSIDVNKHRCRLEIECNDIQPGRSIWTDIFYLGAVATGEHTMPVKVYADNLHRSKQCDLTVDAQIQVRDLDMNGLYELEEAEEES